MIDNLKVGKKRETIHARVDNGKLILSQCNHKGEVTDRIEIAVANLISLGLIDVKGNI